MTKQQVIAKRSSSRSEDVIARLEYLIENYLITRDLEKIQEEIKKLNEKLDEPTKQIIIDRRYINYLKAYTSSLRKKMLKNTTIEEAKQIKKEISRNKADIAFNAEDTLDKKVEIYDIIYEFINQVRNGGIKLKNEELEAYLKDEDIDIYLIVRLIYNIKKKNVIEEINEEEAK